MFVDNTVRELSGGCTEYSQAVGGRPASRAVRRHLELTQTMGLDYKVEASELCARLADAHATAGEIAALSGNRSASDRPAAVEPIPLQFVEADASKATRFGDVLISHAISCISQPIFDRSVILIDEVDEIAGVTRGLVLNAPGGTSLRQLLLRWPQAEKQDWVRSLGPLLDLEVYGGGPVMSKYLSESVTWLHTYGDQVAGAREVAPSLWIGGDLNELAARVAATTAQAQDAASRILPSIWPVVGFAGWAAPQLANEIERGVWIRGRAATSALGRVCLTADSIAAWRAAMRGVGLPQLADFPRSAAVDSRLLKLVETHHKRLMSEDMGSPKSESPDKSSTTGTSRASQVGRGQGRSRSGVQLKGR